MSLFWIAPFVAFGFIALLAVVSHVIYLSCYRRYTQSRTSAGIAITGNIDTNIAVSQAVPASNDGCPVDVTQAMLCAEAGLARDVGPSNPKPRTPSKPPSNTKQRMLYTRPPVAPSPLHYDILNRRYKSVTTGMPLPAASKHTGNYSRKHGRDYEGIARFSEAQGRWRDRVKDIVGRRIEAVRLRGDATSPESEEDELDEFYKTLEMGYALEHEKDSNADCGSEVNNNNNDHDLHNTFSLKFSSRLNARVSVVTSSIGAI
jgi:hypothetical protein